MARSSALALAAALCTGWIAALPSCSSPTATETPGSSQRTFDSPEDAVVALIDAARQGSVAETAPLFGAGFDDLASDSPAQTEGDLQRLAAAYDRRHALLIDDQGSDSAVHRVTLAVGDDLWEFPVPLVHDGAPPRWRFDTATGLEAVWAIRCERNEREALEFLAGCVAAQEEYRQMGYGGPNAYARRFRSEVGRRDGLWWSDDMTPPISPLGPMVDEAVASANPPIDPRTISSYRGYRYRVVEAAGPAAPGGATAWLDSSGALVGGFAFLAWPDEYGRSGVHTYLVSSDGTVWSRDLGAETGSLAAAIRQFDPEPSWVLLLPQ
jgi:hypothetical protein